MKLSDLFRQLAYAELKMHAMSLATPGQIATANQPEVVIHLNEALLRLYSRFILKEKDLIIEMQDGITQYHLLPQFAISQAGGLVAQGDSVDGENNGNDGDSQQDIAIAPWTPTPYIIDMAGEPFLGDVIKILAVYDGHIYGSAYGAPYVSPYTSGDASGTTSTGTIADCYYPYFESFGLRGDNLSNTVTLNDNEDFFSLFTPQPNVLQVPHPKPGCALGVQYQAEHPQITGTDLNQWIELPRVLEGALKAFIAHKVFSYMNGAENERTAQTHLANYESICADVVDKDLVSTSQSTTNIRFSKRGWV